MAFVQSDVDALKTAIAGGVQSVRFADGREVTYRSVSDLQAALAMAEAEVTGSQAGASAVSFASFCKD